MCKLQHYHGNQRVNFKKMDFHIVLSSCWSQTLVSQLPKQPKHVSIHHLMFELLRCRFALLLSVYCLFVVIILTSELSSVKQILLLLVM